MEPRPSPPREIEAILGRLRAHGYRAVVVGGAVRDLLRGVEPKDWDVATAARPPEIARLFAGAQVAAERFGVVVVPLGRGRPPVEVTSFRLDGEYRDGRRPEGVTLTDSLEADLARRDLTINAMALDEGWRVVDPWGGRGDLRSRTLRAVGDPMARIGEDPLRAVRVARFAASLGFRPEPATERALAASAGRVRATVSAERLGGELGRIVAAAHARRGLRVLAGAGLLGDLFPAARPDADRRLEALLGEPDAPTGPEARLALLLLAAGHGPRDGVAALADLALGEAAVARAGAIVRVATLDARALGRPALLVALRGIDQAAIEEGLALRRVAGRRGLLAGDRGALARRLGALRGLPRDRSGLAIGGRELLAAGARPGRELGELIERLWGEVVAGRLPNHPDALLARARQMTD